MKLRLEIRGPHRSFSFEHDGPSLRIGRDPHCDLCLSEKYETVSWQHVRIDLRHGGATVTDLRSTNGTLLNERELAAGSSTRLEEGDVIRLGKTGPQLEVAELVLGKRHHAGGRGAGRAKGGGGGGAAALALLTLGCVALLAGAGYYLYRNRTPPAPPAPAPIPAEKLEEQARAVRQKYCHECHGGKFQKADLDVMDVAQLLEGGYVVPGDLKKSILWERVEDGSMPPSKTGMKVSDDEKEALRQWILKHNFKVADKRKPHQKVIAAIHAHLQQVPEAERRYQRYFTLAHWTAGPNDKADKDAAEQEKKLKFNTKVAWAGLSELLNSLSWEPEITVPAKVDTDEMVFAVDLRKLGWDKADLWAKVIEPYPYGLSHADDEDADTAQKAAEVYDQTRTPIPYVRADWFVATASQPPLYHQVLQLPTTLGELEKKLKVDYPASFKKGELVRAGIVSKSSDVSDFNRLIERLTIKYGDKEAAYWKSYDFGSDLDKASLINYPLGPEFPGNPFPQSAFAHDGGEMIFNLPNGLQAYYLAKGNGEQIDFGPTKIVRHKDEYFGRPEIVNGLSCMHCHFKGMIRKFDQIVKIAEPTEPGAKAAVKKLFASHDKLDEAFSKDEQRFVKAYDKATKDLLPAGAGDVRPISETAKDFLTRTLGAPEIARELGVDDPQEAVRKINASPVLKGAMGLAPLTGGARISRQTWESLHHGPASPMQELARELKLGTPVRPGARGKA
jgi:serine/threonine-protein kinase